MKPAKAVLVATTFTMLAFPSSTPPAAAQQWELEIHGGGLLTSSSRNGRSQVPAASTAGKPSDHVPSWYFGDGDSLLNQVNAALGPGPQIAPLDPMLQSPLLERGSSGSVGFRIGRRLNRRLAAELSVDCSLARTQMSDESLLGVEASRASFVSTWNRLLSRFTSPQVTSVAVPGRGGRPLLVTGVLNVTLVKGRRLEPYVAIGGGLRSELGEALAVSLKGDYRFQALSSDPPPIGFPSAPPFAVLSDYHDVDSVRLRSSGTTSFVGVLGLGLKHETSARWGWRADVRAHLSRNTQRTLLTAGPTILSSGGMYGPQLGNYGPRVNFGSYGRTLGGPPVEDFETFRGTGLQAQVAISAGVFLRF